MTISHDVYTLRNVKWSDCKATLINGLMFLSNGLFKSGGIVQWDRDFVVGGIVRIVFLFGRDGINGKTLPKSIVSIAVWRDRDRDRIWGWVGGLWVGEIGTCHVGG